MVPHMDRRRFHTDGIGRYRLPVDEHWQHCVLPSAWLRSRIARTLVKSFSSLTVDGRLSLSTKVLPGASHALDDGLGRTVRPPQYKV